MVRVSIRAAMPLALAAAILAAGCSRPAPPTGTPAPAPSQVVEVQVKLTDFTLESSLTTFAVGTPYRFVVTNAGAVNHEFMIVPPPSMEGMSMEAMDKMALAMIDEDELPPGATRTLEYTFTKPAASGTLEFACHVEGHYEAGMHVPIVVR